MDNITEKFCTAAVEMHHNITEAGKLLKQLYALLPKGSTLEMKVSNPGKYFVWNYRKSKTEFSSIVSKVEP